MQSTFLVSYLHPSAAAADSLFYCASSYTWKIGCCARDSSEHRFRFKLLGQSPMNKWKLKNLNSDAMQEKLNLWLSKTQDFLSDVASPLVKTAKGTKPDSENASNNHSLDEIFMTEQTIDRRTPNGILSLAAIASIEQFSRLNRLTAQKMQKVFKALVPETVHSDARNFIEYCCFRFLSRDNSTFHPSLREPAFQRLIFITMLAWENPYSEELSTASEKASLKSKLIGEEAFVRIAPAIPGLAGRSTVHNLFKALAGEEQGISLHLWLTYVHELLKAHERRKSNQIGEHFQQSEEKILCTVSSRKPPVLKWENKMAWPGWIILTEKALYFEAVSLKGLKHARRLDLTNHETKVEKAKVGPLGSELFDSAISISSGPGSETWVLEFVDLGGEFSRDVWHAFVNEVISLHKFISEFGPRVGDESVYYVYGANKGKERAVNSAINSVTRLQALQAMRKLPDDPTKLVQFSYLQNAPYGEVVSQALALNYWGGPLVANATVAGLPTSAKGPTEEVVEGISSNVVDLDGNVYLQKWMHSPSWSSSASQAFWKSSSIRKGVVLSKNLVVAGASLVERAAVTCREKSQVVEKTQATIDAAMIKGIPSNIDLFKELLLPLTITVKNFDKLRHWEEPHLTLSFLAVAYTVVFRNLLPYVLPTTLIFMSVSMLTLKGLKDQGRLGRSFGKVTIRDQPPSNTIQKIIALKDAMRDVENNLQNLNITLLKMRTVILSGQPQITTEVALVLLSSATILLVVPFKYVLAFLIFDLFTRELEFRRDMVRRFRRFLKERWDMVPAAPVVVLPYEDTESRFREKREEDS